MAKLVLCSDCARHFRRTEANCPFCGAVVDLAAADARMPVARGLSRARRYAMQAALLAGTAGLAHAGSCGGSKANVNHVEAGSGGTQPQPQPHPDPGPRDDDDHLPAKPYGCVWPDADDDGEPVRV